MGKPSIHPVNRKARILIVDDHPLVREGLALRIARQADMEICGEAADVTEALQLIASTNPDVAIIDISLKAGNGIDLIKRIKPRNDTVRLIVLSMHSESLYAERALRAGAMGYVNKEQATSKIIDAIAHVLNDKIYLSDQAADRLLNRAVGRQPALPERTQMETLSDRELEVFQFYGRGLDTHQIAKEMHLSPKTVETYRSRIKEKLNLNGIADLVCRATQWVVERRE